MTAAANDKSNLTKNTYQVDFKELSKQSMNLVCKSNALELSKTFVKEGKFVAEYSNMVMNLYQIEGRVFCYMSSGMVFELKNDKTNSLSVGSFNSAPEMIGVPYKGERHVLAVSGKTVEILGKEKENYAENYGKFLTMCNGILFCVRENALYFTAPMKDDGGIENVELKNFITLSPYGESIKGLYAFGKKLYIVFENQIYNINVTGSPLDFNVQTENLSGLKVLENTVRGNGDTFYFISDGFLCSYDGKTLKQHKMLEHDITSIEFCGITDGCYLIQYYAQDEYQLRGFDFSQQLPFYTNTVHCFSNYGGKAINSSYEYAIFGEQVNAGFYANYKSKEFNMGSGKKKRITGIEGFSKGKIGLSVKGDFGSETVYIEGPSSYKLNLLSKNFSFQLSCLIGMIPLSDLKIEYQILGG